MIEAGKTMTTDQQQTTAEPTHGLRDTAKDLASESKAAIERAAETTRSTLIEQPTAAAAIAGAAAVAVAVLFGAVEAALGGAAAYGAYRLLRRRKPHAERAAR
jgi:hypothetical protein